MDRNEIERHIADYLNGEISPEYEQLLTAEFAKNPELKEETEELRHVWEALGKLGSGVQMRVHADQKFYHMLDEEKIAANLPAPFYRRLGANFLKAAAAILLFLTAFGLGRYTTETKTVVNYKTVIIKDSSNRPASIAKLKEKPAMIAKSPKVLLNRRLLRPAPRGLNSIFASERLNAVLTMAPRAGHNKVTLARLIRVLKNDESPNVRLAALDVLRPLSGKRDVQLQLISTMGSQDDEMIRRSIIDLLFEVKSGDALPKMVAMLNEGKTDPHTQQQLKAGIERLLN